MINQKDKIIDFMMEYGSITPQDAARMGIMRLAPRIMELKICGYGIATRMETGENEYGKFRYARYVLEG